MQSGQPNPKDDYGLDIVHPPDGKSDRDSNVDIVFVHGLGGQKHKTWAKGDRFWPRDLLAKDFPSARIMTWGYDSRIMAMFGPVGQGGVQKHANELSNDLSAERSQPHQFLRPIIFFAHSLGGLIIKHVLFSSWVKWASPSRNKDRTAALERCTVAVLFAGTPHRGSDKAKWARIAGRLASIVQKDHSSRLAETLAKGSDVLEILQENFKTIENNFHIFSFYEEVPVPKVGAIVEADSAVMDCQHEKKRMLHGNHMEMVRFADAASNSYKKIKDAFAQIHQTELESPTPKDITQPPQRLSTRNDSQGAIEESRANQGQPQIRTLENRASNIHLGSNHHLEIEEIVEQPQRPANVPKRPTGLSVEGLGRLPHRASTTTLATVTSDSSHRSDHSGRSNEAEHSIQASQESPRERFHTLLQTGRSLAIHRNRDFLSNLKTAQTHFHQALHLLHSSDWHSSASNTNPMITHLDKATTYYQLMDVSFNLSFHKPLSPSEKVAHLTKAEENGREAAHHAQMASTTLDPPASVTTATLIHAQMANPTLDPSASATTATDPITGEPIASPYILLAQAHLYLAIVKGRRAELIPRLPPPTSPPLHPVMSPIQQTRNAIAEIDDALSRIRELSPDNWKDSEAFARTWKERLTAAANAAAAASPPPPPTNSSFPTTNSPPQQQQRPPLVAHHTSSFSLPAQSEGLGLYRPESYQSTHSTISQHSQHSQHSPANSSGHNSRHGSYTEYNQQQQQQQQSPPLCSGASTSSIALTHTDRSRASTSSTASDRTSQYSIELEGTTATENLPAYSELSFAGPVRRGTQLPRYSVMDPRGGAGAGGSRGGHQR